MRPNCPLAFSRMSLILVVTIAVAVAGCSDDDDNGGGLLAPELQPQVVNNIDDFQFQTTGVTNVTQTLTYQWRNTGTQANVNQACSISGGSATLVLRDSTGAQVYSRSLADNGTFQTAVGLPSAWSMQVIVTNVSGTLNFRVQKKT